MTKYPIVTVAAVLSMTALLFSQTSKPRVPPVPTSQPQPSQPPREKPPADPGVKALVESFCGAWDDHNPARMAQCWTEDGDFRNAYGRMSMGHEEIKAVFEAEHSAFMKSTTYRVIQMTIRKINPDIAVVDWDAGIDGMIWADGHVGPTQLEHATTIMMRSGTEWHFVSLRAMMNASLPVVEDR